MSEPTIEEVVKMQFWKNDRHCGQIDATHRLLGAAEALLAVLRELERIDPNMGFESMASRLAHTRCRIRAALGEEK